MHKTVRSLFFVLLIACSTFIVGCGSAVPVIKPFKMDIQQGNVVTSKMLLQLRPGMTKSQVKFIMGTPLVVDSFHTNRWDYFYQLRQAGKVVEQRRVILDFEKELLARVRGDVVPQGTPGADTGAVTLANEPITTTAKPAEKEGVFENLQFWKSAESQNAKPVIAPETAKPKAAEKSLLGKLKFWESDTKTAQTAKPAIAKEALATEAKAVETKPVETRASESKIAEAAAAVAAPVVALPDALPSAEDTPSVLAIPIQIAPEISVPDTGVSADSKSPLIAEPMVSAPVAALPAVEPIVQRESAEPKIAETMPAASKSESKPEPATAALPVATPTTPTKQDERFIFRFDKNLDIKNLAAATPQQPVKPVVKTNKADEKIVPAEEAPGYFERMLEKIGF